MTSRTAVTTITFARPFRLDGCEGAFAPGAYAVETDEEMLEGVSFVAYRRVQTALHLHRTEWRPGEGRILFVPGASLDKAIRLDQEGSQNGPSG